MKPALSNVPGASHPLVGEEEGDRSAALFELPGSLQRLAAGIGLQDAIVASIMLAQVALDGAEHFEVVVDSQNHRLDHVNPSPRRSAASR